MSKPVSLSLVPPEIIKRAEELTGRSWVLQEVADWLDGRRERFFLLTAEPGGGKSALAAWLSGAGRAPDAEADAERLTRVRAAWRALHFCVAEDLGGSVEPGFFCEALAKQLADRVPDYGVAVLRRATPSATIDVDQKANTVSGELVGVKIHTLILAERAERAYSRVVRQPLLDTCDRRPDEWVHILVDALDEADTVDAPNIVSLLAGSHDFPRQVRFLVTCRNDESILRLFRDPVDPERFKDARHLDLSDAANAALTDADVRAYILGRAATEPPLAQALGTAADATADALVSRADGNFLYIKFLLDEIAGGRRSASETTQLPRGLYGLYQAYLDRLMPEVRQGPSSAQWQQGFQPLLGVLSVAVPSAPRDLLASWTGLPESRIAAMLGELAQIVETDGAAYRLYHRSMADFLATPEIKAGKASLPNNYITPPLEQHERIARYYLRRSRDGWSDCDLYGLRNAAVHFAALRATPEFRDALYALVSLDVMRTKLERLGSHATFAADVALAIDAAEADGVHGLARKTRACLVYAGLVREATTVPKTALYVMARLGDIDRALGYASLHTDSLARYDAHLEIARGLLAEGAEQRAYEILTQQLSRARDDTERAREEHRHLVAQALFQLGRASDAWQLFDVDEAGVGASAMHDAVSSLCASGRYDRAIEIARTHTDTWRRDQRLQEIAEAAVVGNREDVAWAALDQIDDKWTRAEGARHVLESMAAGGRAEEAIRRAQALDSKRDRALGAIAAAVIARDGPDAARDLLAPAGSRYDDVTTREAVRALAGAGHADQIVALIDRHVPAEARDDVFASGIGGLVAAKQFDAALSMVERIGDEWKRGAAAQEIASYLVRSGALERGVRVFMSYLSHSRDPRYFVETAIDAGLPDDALEAAGRNLPPEALAPAFAASARHLAKSGHVARALRAAVSSEREETLLEVVHAALRWGARDVARLGAAQLSDPDAREAAARALGTADAEAGESERAQKYVVASLARNARGEEQMRAVEVAKFARLAAFAGLPVLSKTVAARAVALADETGPNAMTAYALAIAASALALTGQGTDAAALVDRALAAPSATPPPSGAVAVAVIEALTLLGQLDRAIEIVEQLAWPGDDGAAALGTALAETGDGLAARDALARLNPSARKSAWRAAAVAFARRGATDALVTLASVDTERVGQVEAFAPALAYSLGPDKLRDAVASLESAFGSAGVFRCVASVRAGTSDFDAAWQLANEAPPDQRPNALVSVLRVIHAMEGPTHAWRSAATTLGDAGLLDLAEAVVQDRDAGPPDDNTLAVIRTTKDLPRRLRALHRAVRAVAVVDTDAAIAFADELPPRWERTSALTDVVRDLAKKGMVERALTVVAKLPEDDQASALGTVADELISAKDLSKTATVIARIPNDARSIEPLSRIAQALIDVGERSSAKDTLARAQRLAAAGRVDPSHDWALHEIASALVRAGRIDAAHNVVPAMDATKWPRAALLRQIAASARTGESTKARAAADLAWDGVSRLTDDSQPWQIGALATMPGENGSVGRAHLREVLDGLASDAPRQSRALAAVAHSLSNAAGARPNPGAPMLQRVSWHLARWRARGRGAPYARRAAAIASRLTDPVVRATALAQASLALVTTGRRRAGSRTARAAFDAMQAVRTDIPRATLGLVILALHRAGDRQTATTLLQQALDAFAQLAADEVARAQDEEALAEAVAVAGSAEQIDRFVTAGLAVEATYLWHPIRSLVSRLADAARWTEAAAVTDRLVHAAAATTDERSRAIRLQDALAAAVFANRGEAWRRALAALDTIQNTSLTPRALAFPARLLAEFRRGDDAAAAAAERALASVHAEAQDRTEVLANAVATFELTGRHDRALEVLSEAISQTRQARGNFLELLGRGANTVAAIDGGVSLAQIAESLIEVEDWWATLHPST